MRFAEIRRIVFIQTLNKQHTLLLRSDFSNVKYFFFYYSQFVYLIFIKKMILLKFKIITTIIKYET